MMNNSGRKYKSIFFLLFFFSLSFTLPSQESGTAPPETQAETVIMIPRPAWVRFQQDWAALKAGYAKQSEAYQNLQRNYDLLLPKLELSETRSETLASRLPQSEETSAELARQLKTSTGQLTELNDSLRKQTGQITSLSREVKFYRTGFYITLGISVAGIGAAALLLFVR